MLVLGAVHIFCWALLWLKCLLRFVWLSSLVEEDLLGSSHAVQIHIVFHDSVVLIISDSEVDVVILGRTLLG